MSDLHAAIEHFENSPALRREFAYTLQAMKDARDALEQAQIKAAQQLEMQNALVRLRDEQRQRIEQLEAALNWIGDAHIDDMTKIMDYARESAQSTGGTLLDDGEGQAAALSEIDR